MCPCTYTYTCMYPGLGYVLHNLGGCQVIRQNHLDLLLVGRAQWEVLWLMAIRGFLGQQGMLLQISHKGIDSTKWSTSPNHCDSDGFSHGFGLMRRARHECSHSRWLYSCRGVRGASIWHTRALTEILSPISFRSSISSEVWFACNSLRMVGQFTEAL